MQVVIRADASSQMGSGHLMRCLTLAEELCEERHAKVTFICRDLPGNLSQMVVDKGFDLQLLPFDENIQYLLEDCKEHKRWLGASVDTDRAETLRSLSKLKFVDLLVVDHYALDDVWETPMRQYAKKIMVIDDLADRRHDCDILLDQNYYKNAHERYGRLTPATCERYLGPQFALLRKDVRRYRPDHPKKILAIKNILVNFGAADPKNYCLKLIKMFQNNQELFSQYRFLFVTGSMSVCKNEVLKMSNDLSFCKVIEKSDDFSMLMRDADLFVGAAGATSWERALLGLPAIVCSVAKNQDKIASDGDQLFHMLLKDLFDSFEFAESLKKLDAFERISNSSFSLMSNWSMPNLIQAIK